MSKRIEIVPSDRAIFQSDQAKTYRCPYCKRPIFSQYEGDELPSKITCDGPLEPHCLIWD